jgi:hypothetical protein
VGNWILQDAPLGPLDRLRKTFSQPPDPRQAGKVRHRLDEVFMCAFCAVLSDADSFTDMEDFTAAQPLAAPVPCAGACGTLPRCLPQCVHEMVQPQTMLEILGRWCGALDGMHVAIDGKTLRGTHDAELGRHKVHLLRAWVDDRSPSASQVLCGEKINEIEAIPRLLAAMALDGATVTERRIGQSRAARAESSCTLPGEASRARACQKSAEAIVARKAVKAAGAKGRMAGEGSQSTARLATGKQSHETPWERQLRQLPGAVVIGGVVDPRSALATRRRAWAGRERRWKKMPEDNQGSAMLEAVLAQENLRAAWLAVRANGGAPGVRPGWTRWTLGRAKGTCVSTWGRSAGSCKPGTTSPEQCER